MSIIKVLSPNSQKLGDAVAKMIKLSRSGLVGQDLRDFVKRAGHPFVDMLRQVTFEKGEVPIHLIALGDTETYGPNRNGDGFKTAACRKYHDTFVKFARFYRNHKNKDKSKSYGVVKLSMFNEPMRRIELIVALNGTKEAAERNGGLVADDELEKLANDRETGVSMACRVAYDVCSGCGNRAKSRSEYCKGTDEGGMCKAGGLKNRICTVLNDGHILHADNPHPEFFDISHVHRPADRIAYVFGKAASAGSVIGGAELAEELGVTEPLSLLVDSEPELARQLKCAHELSEAEKRIEQEDQQKTANHGRAFQSEVQTEIPELGSVSKTEVPLWLRAFAGQKIALSLREFIRLTTGDSSEKCDDLAVKVARFLPGVHCKLISDESLENMLKHNPYRPSSLLAPASIRMQAVKYAADYSLDQEHVNRRVLRSVLRKPGPSGAMLKRAAGPLYKSQEGERMEKIAKQYALYKIGLLSDIHKDNDDLQLTADLMIRQNYINHSQAD